VRFSFLASNFVSIIAEKKIYSCFQCTCPNWGLAFYSNYPSTLQEHCFGFFPQKLTDKIVFRPWAPSFVMLYPQFFSVTVSLSIQEKIIVENVKCLLPRLWLSWSRPFLSGDPGVLMEQENLSYTSGNNL
jgi:hypothetical protein